MGVLLLTSFVVEIVLLVAVASAIGAIPTVFLLIGVSLLGITLVRYEGARLLSQGLASGERMVDGSARLVAALLVAAPGLVSTAAGAALYLPPVRRVIRPFAFARATSWTGFTKRFGADVIDAADGDVSPRPSQSTRTELGFTRSTDER
ncbi:MAG: FxsA family protein [Actinomycetota bacterium]|nr:FxsA family protein [Actinomycetota bacterium]